MNIKELLGDSFREDLTVSEIENLLKDKNLVDPSSLPKSVSKDVYDKTASELAKYKKDLKEIQEASMTADEKLKAELEKAQIAQKTYAKELAKLKAKEVFVEAGLSEKDYSTILGAIVSEDEEVTTSVAKSMVDLINSQKSAVEKAVKADLLKSTPKPVPGVPDDGMTKEKFSKLTLAEKQQFAVEHPEQYKAIYKEE